MPILKIMVQNNRWFSLDASDKACGFFGVEIGQVCTTQKGTAYIMLGVWNQKLFFTIEGSHRVYFNQHITNKETLLTHFKITETKLTFNTLKAAIDLPMRLEAGELPAASIPNTAKKRKWDDVDIDETTKRDWTKKAIELMTDVAQGCRPGLRQYEKKKRTFIRNYFAMFYHRRATSRWEGREAEAKRLRLTLYKLCPEVTEDDDAEASNKVAMCTP